MAGKSSYTEAEKAQVYVTLQANDFNVKRTARETGTPENTVRRWRDEWKKSGPPAEELVWAAAETFLNMAVETRQMALDVLRAKIPDAKPGELITIIGVLDDKITRAKGLATSRQEHVFSLPSAEEMRQLLAPALSEAYQLAENRQNEIIDAELVEPKALPRTVQG